MFVKIRCRPCQALCKRKARVRIFGRLSWACNGHHGRHRDVARQRHQAGQVNRLDVQVRTDQGIIRRSHRQCIGQRIAKIDVEIEIERRLRRYDHLAGFRRDGVQFQIWQLEKVFQRLMGCGTWLSNSDRKDQRAVLAFAAHELCTVAKCARQPPGIAVGGDVGNPVFETSQRLPAQGTEPLSRIFLVRHPAIEHLLERPGCCTELVEPDHSGTAFQCVKSSSQDCQLR